MMARTKGGGPQLSSNGRTGKVFSIRLTDPEREEIEKAAARYEDGPSYWRRPMPLGKWIKTAALEKARWVKKQKVARKGTTKTRPH